MANSFKTFLPEDIANTRTLLHEAIPLTGTIVSGTYADNNIKEFSSGMFQTVYDYPYLSSSNHIFDITWGYYSGSSMLEPDAGQTIEQSSKKKNIYNQMAMVLNTPSVTGKIRAFDRDGAEDEDVTDDMRHCVFLSFARLLNKDEIKKDSLRLSTFTRAMVRPGSADDNQQFSGSAKHVTIGDYNAQTNYKTNSPAGEYGMLYTNSAGTGTPLGHVYYQAGIVVLTASIWEGQFGSAENVSLMTQSMDDMLISGTIDELSDGFRYALSNIQFNNTTELNSTIYFARAHNTEFNYSANPTYLSSSQIRVKGENPAADPVSYVTSVGLYSPDNELIAVAKLSEPLKKSPSNEITLRVRLDY